MSVGRRDASKAYTDTSRHSLRIVNIGKAFLMGTQLIYQFENVKEISAYRRFNASGTCLSACEARLSVYLASSACLYRLTKEVVSARDWMPMALTCTRVVGR